MNRDLSISNITVSEPPCRASISASIAAGNRFAGTFEKRITENSSARCGDVEPGKVRLAETALSLPQESDSPAIGKIVLQGSLEHGIKPSQMAQETL